MSLEIAQRLQAAPSPLHLLANAAQHFPERHALEFLREDLLAEPLAISYRDLHQEVRALAAGLHVRGIQPDEAVAILLPFMPQAVSALIAASAVAVAFPVNLLLSAEALRAQLSLARCRLVITLGEHPALDIYTRVQQAIAGMPDPPAVVSLALAGENRAWRALLAEGEIPVADPRRVGALVHTGGTTGHPKLARLSLHNMAAGALMAACGLELQTTDRLLSGLPLFHVGGAIDALLAGLAIGASVVFPTPLGMRNPAVVANIWSIIQHQGINLLGAVPTSLAAILDSPLGAADLSALRAVMTGGSPLPQELSLRLQEKIGKPVCQLYGMTETSGIASAQPTHGQAVPHAVGNPVPLQEICLGTPGNSYQAGARGEILLRGPNLFQGYLTNQGVQGEPRDGWFASGDLGEVGDDGQLRIVGRCKDVIIRSGHNIDPQLIEEVAHRHPAVAQAVAVAMPDDYAGEVPVLFVVARAGQPLTTEALAAYINDHIAEPPARPKQLFLLNELPLTPFAKVARYRLRQSAVEYRLQAALQQLCPGCTVSCTDPTAKSLHIQPSPDVSQREQVLQLLGRFDLRLED